LKRLLSIAAPLVGALCSGCAPETAPEGAPERPSVVLIVLDTLRTDQLTAYGQTDDRSPYLTELARRSAVFTNTHSTSSWTAPSTASILTGTYDDRHGVEEGFLVQLQRGVDRIDLPTLQATTPTIPQVLQRNGYTTFGLTANINIGPEMKFDRGFDRFERHETWNAQDVLKRLRQWKIDIDAADPYFLYLHLNDVHKPYQVRERWYQAEGGRDEDAFARYKSELGFMDTFLARIHALFEWDQDVLLIVTSDHGEEFYDHGEWGHHFTLYGEVNRSVFFVFGPGLGVLPARIEQSASVIDIQPTLLELVDIEPPVPPDGVSWSRAVQGGPRPGPRTLFAHRIEKRGVLWSAITDDWKLIEGMPGGSELYDLRSDPAESENLALSEPGKLAELAASIAEQRKRNAGATSTREGVEIDAERLQHLRDLGYVDD